MNVLIITDLEGITNVDSINAIFPQNAEQMKEAYKARENLMLDVNAAACGFFDAGVEHVYVIDGHAAGKNFLMEMLDSRVEFLTRDVWESYIIEKKVDIQAEIGIHSKAGTINGFLDHTQSSLMWFDYRVNGTSYGEIFQTAAFAGVFDIPVVMVSGDMLACEQARELLGDIETAEVKNAVGRNKAISLSSQQARMRIYEAAKRSVALKDKIKPLKMQLPAVVSVTFTRTDYCEQVNLTENMCRIDARTIEKRVNKIERHRDLLI